jgi:hypothetical protein
MRNPWRVGRDCVRAVTKAGKRKSGKVRKRSPWLRRCLWQGTWGVSTKKNNYLSALYRRLAARRGSKRATIAVAHNLLVIAYYILRQDLLPRPVATVLEMWKLFRPA